MAVEEYYELKAKISFNIMLENQIALLLIHGGQAYIYIERSKHLRKKSGSRYLKGIQTEISLNPIYDCISVWPLEKGNPVSRPKLLDLSLHSQGAESLLGHGGGHA